MFDNLGKFLIVEAGCLLGFFFMVGVLAGAALLGLLLLTAGCR